MGCGASVLHVEKRYTKSFGYYEEGYAEPAIITTEEPNNSKLLSLVSLFKSIAPDTLEKLANLAVELTYERGQVVITQGEPSSDLFIIKSGRASVDQDGKVIKVLQSGDYFGEHALFYDVPRIATIRATKAMVVLRITRADCNKLSLRQLIVAPTPVVAFGDCQNQHATIQPPVAMDKCERDLVSAALRGNSRLNAVVPLDDEKIDAMAAVMWRQDVQQGSELISEGDVDSYYFYIIWTGSFEVTKTTHVCSGVDVVQSHGILSSGDSFGELALLHSSPRAATLTAREYSSVFVMASQQFRQVLLKDNDKRAQIYKSYLDVVKIFNVCTDAEKQELAKNLLEMRFRKDHVVFKQGEVGNKFYMLIKGEVSVTKDDEEVARLVASTDGPDLVVPSFGETAILKKVPRNSTITVLSDVAVCLTVDKMCFELLIGSYNHFSYRREGGLKRLSEQSIVKKRAGGAIRRKDLCRVSYLGCGSLALVELVQHKETRKLFALKSVSKGVISKAGIETFILREKTVQLALDSPFIVQLYETFTGPQHVFFLMEAVLGGDLSNVYHRKNFFGSTVHAKFYSSCVALAIDHMHVHKVLYRDLKPENLLLDERGYIKVTDFGLAKVVPALTYTMCGTTNYLAPEVLASRGYTHAVDWWCLGILLFELLAGDPPFFEGSPMETYAKIVVGIQKVCFPPLARGAAGDLIKALCDHNPSERLSMKAGGSNNLRNHEYYAGVEWAAVENRTIIPPYQPNVSGVADWSNVKTQNLTVPPFAKYTGDLDKKRGWDASFATAQ